MKVSLLRPPAEARRKFTLYDAGFVPQAAGCYALTNASKEILYVGKAKNLRRRMVKHLKDDKKRGLTPYGKAWLFYYTLREASRLSSLECGWLNSCTDEDGEKPYFNMINASV